MTDDWAIVRSLVVRLFPCSGYWHYILPIILLDLHQANLSFDCCCHRRAPAVANATIRRCLSEKLLQLFLLPRFSPGHPPNALPVLCQRSPWHLLSRLSPTPLWACSPARLSILSYRSPGDPLELFRERSTPPAPRRTQTKAPTFENLTRLASASSPLRVSVRSAGSLAGCVCVCG